jgi:peptidoglycan/LPS O-acetylase OafA/YrhL
MQKFDLRRIIVPAFGGAIMGAVLARLSSPSTVHIAIWAIIGLGIGILIELMLGGLYWIVQIARSPRAERFLRRYSLAGFWLLSIPIYIAGGNDAQFWAQAWFRQAQPYPYLGVLTNIAFSGIVVGCLYLIIRPWSFRYSMNRLTLSLIGLMGLFFSVIAVISDPPGFQDAQTLWLLLVILGLLVALILTARGSRMRIA